MSIQDADQMDDSIKEQMAERMLPEAALWTLLRASERQGREDLVNFYLGELMNVIMQKRQAAEAMQQQMAAQQGPPPGPEGPMGPGGPPMPMGPDPMGPGPMGPGPMGPGPMGPEGPLTLDPRVMPNAMMGVPPPTPTPQAGPLVPPGTPRPGAQGRI